MRNNTQTAVTNMTKNRMLKSKIIYIFIYIYITKLIVISYVSSNDAITVSQHLFSERRPLPACTQNGTPSHLGNTK